jgi:hypothetical protein
MQGLANLYEATGDARYLSTAVGLVEAGVSKLTDVDHRPDGPKGWRNCQSQIHELQYVSGCLHIMALDPKPALVAPLRKIVDYHADKVACARDKHNHFGMAVGFLSTIVRDPADAAAYRRLLVRETDLLRANDFVWDTRSVGTVSFPVITCLGAKYPPAWMRSSTVSHANREAEFWYWANRLTGDYTKELELLRNTFDLVIYRPTEECPWALATWVDGRRLDPSRSPRNFVVPGVYFGWFYVASPEVSLKLINGWLFSKDPRWHCENNNNTKPPLATFCLAAWGAWLTSPARAAHPPG